MQFSCLQAIKDLTSKCSNSCTTKRKVWLLYCEALGSTHHKVAYSTFLQCVAEVCPTHMVTKPCLGLSEEQRGNNKGLKNKSPWSSACSMNVLAIFDFVVSTPPSLFSAEACLFDGMVHYSFDMAQQVHYPSNPLQPGPIYFLTPRKCALFGVCIRIDGAFVTGNGANTIVTSSRYCACLNQHIWNLEERQEVDLLARISPFRF